MKCPNCNNKDIPKDSRYCPYCGTSLLTQKDLLQQVGHIKHNYTEGFQFFVDNGTLPKYSLRLSIDNCQKILAMKEEIILKQLEVVTKERDALKKDTKSVITPESSPQNLRVYIKESIIPYWPKGGRGSCLSKVEIQGLESGLSYVERLMSNEQQSPFFNGMCQFVDQCIKAILDINKGYTPYFRGMMQNAPNYWHFWQELKDKCGESTYNPYFHYNSGEFADMTREALQKL